MSGHFLPRHKARLKDVHTWAMSWGGRDVRSRTDYILYTYSCLFQNVSVQDMQHNTDHYLVLGCLLVAEPAAHSLYLGKRIHSPIRPLANPDKAYCMFAELRGAIPKTPQQERHC